MQIPEEVCKIIKTEEQAYTTTDNYQIYAKKTKL